MKYAILYSVIALSTPAVAQDYQPSNRSGWSQSDGTSTGRAGEYRDGTSWFQQNDGSGGSAYSDTSGRSCWTQNLSGVGPVTSCNR